jgi:hypothetical protein
VFADEAAWECKYGSGEDEQIKHCKHAGGYTTVRERGEGGKGAEQRVAT